MQDQNGIPAAPGGLPGAVETKWKAAYQVAFTSMQGKDSAFQMQHALQVANATLATPELASYEDAMSLEEWHFVLRKPSADGKTLRVVTRHGDKYLFPIPANVDKVSSVTQ
jgi:hypothetical protein